MASVCIEEKSLGEVLFPLTWLIRLGSGSATFGASKGGIGYQKTKVLPVKTDNLMQVHPAGPWWWVGVHRRYSTGTVFFIETNNLPIVCVAISFAIARRDGSTTRWHLLTSAHIIPRPHSTEREQYHWACLPWIFILKLAQQWNTQSQVHNKMPMARCRSGSSRCLQSSRKLFRPSYCGRTR